ncbi:unnamed protein product, partial [marine sediment metagenome]
IQELIEKSKENVIAIMCSETDYKKCHRGINELYECPIMGIRDK